jgi:hypothetical protein
MDEKSPKQERVPTPSGNVLIRSFCKPDEINQYTFDNQFGVNDDYKSLYTRRESLAESAVLGGANVVLALAESKTSLGMELWPIPIQVNAGLNWGPRL